MSRIRSVHPDQWSDEDFVSLSFPARLLAIAIRNECDDKGVFVWKPLTIKMRLFPADNIDVEPLLDEIESADLVRQYTVQGKRYGAVRNFRVFQRPKKPNDVYPLPDELRTYVGLDNGGSEPVENQSGTSPENEPQMEDGGESKTPFNPPSDVAKPSADTKPSVTAILSEVVSEDQASAFWAHRLALRKKLTDRAARGVVSNLRKIRDGGGDPVRALDLAIERGWATCEPEWFFKASARGDVQKPSTPSVELTPEQRERYERLRQQRQRELEKERYG